MSEHNAGFGRFPLQKSALETLEQLGYREPTPIQEAALPAALSGKDLIARSDTGSGKTAVFALALLDRINQRRFAVQALVLCPTRELADQVASEIRRLARGEDNVKVVTLCGGVPVKGQVSTLEHGAHVAVGTPGRVADHLGRGTLSLEAVGTFVLDEADRMLDMGFYEDIAYIAEHCPAERQTLLFSATYPPGIRDIADRFLRSPLTVEAEPLAAGQAVDERLYATTEEERFSAVERLLDRFRPTGAIVFCNTRQRCRDLTAHLRGRGYSALELHGELDQWEREQVLARFAGKSVAALVATDVASRGLDISGLEAVVNAELPPDPENYVHRIGRTGRAGASGLAVSLASPEEEELVRRVEAFAGRSLPRGAPEDLEPSDAGPLVPPTATIQIQAGKRDKLRPADILGALTGEAGYAKEAVGKIKVCERCAYVAVDRAVAAEAARQLDAGRIKGRSVRVRLIPD
jgi:ATP-independent RNA helicase DbpA